MLRQRGELHATTSLHSRGCAGCDDRTFVGAWAAPAGAQLSLVDPNLGVRTVASGLVTPEQMAFIGPNDFLVLEKNTGAVKRVTNGVVQGIRPRPLGQLRLRARTARDRLASRLPDESRRLSRLGPAGARRTSTLTYFGRKSRRALGRSSGDVRPAGHERSAPRPAAREPGRPLQADRVRARLRAEREEAARVPERRRAGSSWTR